eukprot:GAFH01002582.1.p1 GENE.GAFH01002582.1~~GAFH01002582.1.p1  ORF type:complete len:201 (-),score=55.00 GAFH01002582.1:347-949(-)
MMQGQVAGSPLGLGDAHFLMALREDTDAWVFGFGQVPVSSASVRPTLTHLVAWRPVQVDPSATQADLSDAALWAETATNVTFTLPWPADQLPAVQAAVQLGGAQLVSMDPTVLLVPLGVSATAGNSSDWQATVSAFPIVLKLANPVALPLPPQPPPQPQPSQSPRPHPTPVPTPTPTPSGASRIHTALVFLVVLVIAISM